MTVSRERGSLLEGVEHELGAEPGKIDFFLFRLRIADPGSAPASEGALLTDPVDLRKFLLVPDAEEKQIQGIGVPVGDVGDRGESAEIFRETEPTVKCVVCHFVVGLDLFPPTPFFVLCCDFISINCGEVF